MVSVVQDGDLPRDVESESVVLGSLFRDETYIHRVSLMLDSADFYSPNNRGVYNAMLSLSEKGVPIGVLTLIEEGADQGTVLKLEDLTPTATACMHFAQKVKNTAYQREVYRYGYHLLKVSKQCEEPTAIEDITQAVGLGYENILNKSTGKGDDVYSGDGITGLCDTIKDKRKNAGIHGIRTQFPLFDRVVKGLKTINLITATTGFGKTALALQWAYNIGVRQNIPSLYINYEMEADELTERLLACGSGVWLDKIQTGDIPNADCQKVDDTAKLLGESKLNITGCQSKTIDHTLNLIHQYHRKAEIQVVFIDYIGEITPKDSDLDRGTYTTYGDWVQRIKDCCSRLKIKAVILAQVNRSGYNEMPSVENIAGSMQLPQKANVFVSMCLDKEENVVLNISKNRGGAVPQPIPLFFDKKCQRIGELADNPPF